MRRIFLPSVPNPSLCLGGEWVGMKVVAAPGSRRLGAATFEVVLLKVVPYLCNVLHDGRVDFLDQQLDPARVLVRMLPSPTQNPRSVTSCIVLVPSIRSLEKPRCSNATRKASRESLALKFQSGTSSMLSCGSLVFNMWFAGPFKCLPSDVQTVPSNAKISWESPLCLTGSRSAHGGTLDAAFWIVAVFCIKSAIGPSGEGTWRTTSRGIMPERRF